MGFRYRFGRRNERAVACHVFGRVARAGASTGTARAAQSRKPRARASFGIANGHIVTNYHVIEKANELQVTLADRSSFKAVVVGAEPDKDVAVIRIEAKLARSISIACSMRTGSGKRSI